MPQCGVNLFENEASILNTQYDCMCSFRTSLFHFIVEIKIDKLCNL